MTTEKLQKKRIRLLVIGLFIIFGGIIAWNIFKSLMIKRFFSTYEPPAVTVSSVTAKKSAWYPSLSSVGNFLAVNGVEVNAQTSGNVVKIFFQSGEYVTEEQPLINIDDSVLQAQLKFNQAELALKDVNYKRQESLYKKGATPISSLDEAKANLDQAKANVEKIQAEIRQKHISAPFDGRLGIRLVNLGQYITPGETPIVTLQSLDPLYIDFYLPEQNLKDIHIGQNLYLSVQNYPDLQFKGTINAINSKVDPNTHNVKVQGILPNCSAAALAHPDQSKLLDIQKTPGASKRTILCDTGRNRQENIKDPAFVPGMFASIDIELPPIPDQIILPATAISYSLYGNSVYLIQEDKNTQKSSDKKPVLRVKRVFVTTGEQSGTQILIEKGVREGQQIVSSGEIKLQNGTAITINNSVKLRDIRNAETMGQ